MFEALNLVHGKLMVHDQKPWKSITFKGVRHTMTILFSGDKGVAEGEIFIAELDDREFNLPGQFVADATVTRVESRPGQMKATIEILVLEDS